MVLGDQCGRLAIDLGPGVEFAHSGRPRRVRGTIADQREQLATVLLAEFLQGQRQQHGRPPAEHVATANALVGLIVLPVVQVVDDLVGYAQVSRVSGDRIAVRLDRSGQADPGQQGRFERGRRLQGVDLQGVERTETLLPGVAPDQFGALAFAELGVCPGKLCGYVGGYLGRQGVALRGDQPVAEPDEKVADVDRRGGAVLVVQRGPPVAEGVVVFDVVVYQRGLVEDLDGQRHAFDGVGDLGHLPGAVGGGARPAAQRVVDGQRDERPRMLAAGTKEVVGDRFGAGDRIQLVDRRAIAVLLGQHRIIMRPRHQAGQLGRLEHLRGTPHQVQVG